MEIEETDLYGRFNSRSRVRESTPCREAAKSTLWIWKILSEARVEQPKPVTLYTDSKIAEIVALNPYDSARTRNLDIRYK